jgi:hypothetical protein
LATVEGQSHPEEYEPSYPFQGDEMAIQTHRNSNAGSNMPTNLVQQNEARFRTGQSRNTDTEYLSALASCDVRFVPCDFSLMKRFGLPVAFLHRRSHCIREGVFVQGLFSVGRNYFSFARLRVCRYSLRMAKKKTSNGTDYRLRAISTVITERGIEYNGQPIVNANQFRLAAGIASTDTARPLFSGLMHDKSNRPLDRPLQNISRSGLSKIIALCGISLDEPLSTLFEPDVPVNGKAKKKAP